MSWVDQKLPSAYERRAATGGNYYFVDRSSLVWGDVSMGRLTIVGSRSVVVGHSPIQAGAFCRFGTRLRCVTHEQHHQELPSTFMFGDVFDLDWSHGCGAIGLTKHREVLDPFPISIGHDVTAGNDVHIFGGVTVGNGCIIRPGSLVNRDCVAHGIYEGVPARLVGMRFCDRTIEELNEIQWWNWPIETIRANPRFFQTDITRWLSSLNDLIDAPPSCIVRAS